MSRAALVLALATLSLACSSSRARAPASPVGPAPTAPIVSTAGAPAPAPPADVLAPAPAALEPAARAAFVTLRTAATFDDTRIGLGGELSPNVAAFRALLADKAGAAGFRALVAGATPAGRLYGVSGLYFADPDAFDAAVAEVSGAGGDVATRHGCLGSRERVAEVLRSPDSKRIAVRQGDTLASWFGAHPKIGACDIGGGCVPLSFVDDGRGAPRDPAR
jgi:hypothetical protein